MSEPKTKLQKYSAPALEKGLDIIEFLSLSDQAPNLSQLADGVSRSKNEIFRMVIVLEERGYIERKDGDVFRLTGKLALLGGERTDNNKLAEIAEPHMQRLATTTELSNYLCVPSNDENIIVINSVRSPRNLSVNVQVGSEFSVFPSAVGACFLSHMSTHSARMEYLQSTFSAIDIEQCREFVHLSGNCSKDNLVSLVSPESQSVEEVSAPIRNQKGNAIIAVLSVPYLISSLADNRFDMVAKALLTTVKQIQESVAIAMPLSRERSMFSR